MMPGPGTFMKNSESIASIVLVGNGPSAVSWQAGYLIDKFDLVVRFNNFILKGYEPWVGTKTDVWVINGPEYTVDAVPPGSQIVYSVPLPLTDHDLYYIAVLLRLKTSLTVLDENVIKTAKHHFYSKLSNPDSYGELPYPSTGAIIAHFLLAQFPVVHVFGFDFMQGDIHHYFESTLREDLLDWHNPSAEKSFFESLIATGKVRPLRPL